MPETQITKDQHYVPKFYLKRFADSQGFLDILDVKNRRLASRRAYSSVCYDKFFYGAVTGQQDEVSQVIEKWLQQIENEVGQKLPHIIKKILAYEHIDNEDRYILAVLLSMLWLRSPGMRKQINSGQEDLMKQIMRFRTADQIEGMTQRTGREMTDEEKEKLARYIHEGDYSIQFPNTVHLRLLAESLGFGGPGFANMFFAKKWRIYIARGNERFITSDSPVVEWFEPPITFYGTTFMERNHYLALTPEIFIELLPPEGSSKVQRKTIFNDQDDLVRMYNCLIIAFSYKYAYSGVRRSLEERLAGVRSQGRPEAMYRSRFVRQWPKR